MIFTSKTLVRILLIIFFYGYTYGQVSEKNNTELDSLHRLIKQVDTKEKIDPFLELSLYYSKIDTENLDSIRYYANQALVLSKQYEDTEEKKVEAYISLCYADIYAGNFEKATPYAQEALALSKKLDYGDGLLFSNKALGRLLIDQENYTEGLYYYNKAYEVANKYGASKDKIIDVAIDLSTEYLLLEYTQEASNLLVDATKLLDDPSVSLESKGIFYTNLAFINQDNKNYEKAIEYYNLSIDYYKQDNNLTFQMAPMSNMANIYQDIQEYRKAIDIHEQTLELANTINNSSNGSALHGIGICYLHLEEYDKAKKYFLKSERFHDSINYTFREAGSAELIGRVNLKQNKKKEARTYFEKASELFLESIAFNKNNNIRKDEISIAYLSLSEIDSIYKNPERSLQYYKQHVIYKDSVENERKIKIAERIEFAKETEKKNQEIIVLENQNKIQQVNAEKQRYLEIGLMIFLVLVMLLLGVVSNRYRLKQKALKIIEEKNEENQLLMREIHHRVKNNLQIISSLLGTQIDKHITNNELKAILQESQNKIKSMAIIHQNLYKGNQFAKVSVSSYIRELIDHIQKSFEKDNTKIQFDLDIDPKQIQIGLAVPLGLILNELITNCYKYAFSDKNAINNSIKIVFNQIDDSSKYRLIIKDNGKGLPQDFDLNNLSSFGMQLVQGLVEQLHGEIQINQEQGTTFTMHMEEPTTT
ncbi:tetratricopeptide repeat protein [uncultured Dokdonia sp.]|uniref:tetratricopeptide repeat protein n=1 Tax=uncultured Dokdonia sp. TaxID=575653 RepID=UPI00261EEC46|nr:tetratricopeptide repeat protein [uncultured Dokdonia sp.]